MESRSVSLSDFLKEKNLILDDDVLKNNDAIVIPHPTLNTDDVTVIKRLRANQKKVHIHDFEERKYSEYRGGEYDLALMFIDKVLLPITVSIVTTWIISTVKSWKKTKEEVSPKTDTQPPGFKMEFYIKDDKKYVKIEGDAETALKELKKLQDD